MNERDFCPFGLLIVQLLLGLREVVLKRGQSLVQLGSTSRQLIQV